MTSISGAVIAEGRMVVASNVKKVQHPTGGVVGQLLVDDGARVKAGDLLLKLDDTQSKASLAIILKGLDEQMARQARLEAERDGADDVVFPADLTARVADPAVQRLMTGEQRLFQLRKEARAGQKRQLHERIEQLHQQIGGLTGQDQAKIDEISLLDKELAAIRELWSKKLVSISRLDSLERDATHAAGEHGQLIASTAEAKGKIAETELQVLQVDQDLRSDVAKELAEINGKVAELSERRVAAEDQLRRIDIRAPQSGVVQELAVHTIGGVITPSEPIMLIVPDQDALTVETRVMPNDIDQVYPGQEVTVRFPAFNQRTTPELVGQISRVAADLTQDQKTNASYYTVRVSISDAEFGKLGKVKLVAGMPAEVFIRTTDRSVLSYFVKPLFDQIAKAFRDK